MRAFITVIVWSSLGALVAGVAAFGGLLTYFSISEPTDASDIRAWQTFSAAMGGLAFAVGGLVIGGIFGIVRVRRAGRVPEQE